MAEHLRFSTAYWHSFCADGSDPFGKPTIVFPFDSSDPFAKADAAFEFFTKLGTPFYAFHDVDVFNDIDDGRAYEKRYQEGCRRLVGRQKASGVKLLWNTSNVFSHPRYMNGAATNPDFNVVARQRFKSRRAWK